MGLDSVLPNVLVKGGHRQRLSKAVVKGVFRQRFIKSAGKRVVNINIIN